MQISDIETAITRKLRQEFGSSYRLYTEEVPQDFTMPCFFVQFLNLEQFDRLGKQWRVNTFFNVQYFGVGARNMTLKVQNALNIVQLVNGQYMRATKPNSEMVDGVAHNFMSFNFTLAEVEAKQFMESLEYRGVRYG